MMNRKKLLVMAGGTGGHIFPALEVARHLLRQGWEVRWLGTSDRMEARLVPQHGLEIDFIRISGIRGKGLGPLLSAPARIFIACRQARVIMKTYKPDVVLGMGGYVSGPGGLAAYTLGIPVVLHEQNAVAGLTNKWLAKIATKVMQAFPGALLRAEVVGNPIQAGILALPTPDQRLNSRDGPLRVLVMGGSQGARILNELMPKIAARLEGRAQFWHQVGKGAVDEVQMSYKGINQGQHFHRVTEFIEDVPSAYSWADIVICRAGALTVSEIAAVGVAAIFVPYPHKDRQQFWNALPLAEAGAAKIFEQSEFTEERVVDLLSRWDRSALLTMGKKARQKAILDATDKVALAVSAAALSVGCHNRNK